MISQNPQNAAATTSPFRCGETRYRRGGLGEGDAEADDDNLVALYHVVRPRESFEHAANALFEIVGAAERQSPGKKRVLFLDIEGHRNSEGGFDHDMLELQKNFIMTFLGEWLSGVRMPLVSFDKPGQRDDVPDDLQIAPSS